MANVSPERACIDRGGVGSVHLFLQEAQPTKGAWSRLSAKQY
jgi:hypothetical protein